MSKSNAASKKSKKKVLLFAATVVTAAAIMMSGTFAWFTSSDEVVNELKTAGNFSTTIAESFTPPSEWLPGQDINKDVYIVNTGSSDALVRVSLAESLTKTIYVSYWNTDWNRLDLTVDKDTNNAITWNTNAYPEALASQYTEKMKADAKDNSKFADGTTEDVEYTAIELTADEVAAIEAGGQLVYSPDYEDIKEAYEYYATKQTSYYDGANTVDPGETNAVDSDTGRPATYSFTPKKPGVYVFNRTALVDGELTKFESTDALCSYFFTGSKYFKLSKVQVEAVYTYVQDPDYADNGIQHRIVDHVDLYYEVALKGTQVRESKFFTPDNNTYYAYNTPIAGDTTLTTKESSLVPDYKNYKGYYSQVDGVANKFTDSKIILNFAVDWGTSWTFDNGYFYYNDVLEAGQTTSKLLDSVYILSSADNNYCDVDYKIKIVHDSIQPSAEALNTLWQNSSKTFADGTSTKLSNSTIIKNYMDQIKNNHDAPTNPGYDND